MAPSRSLLLLATLALLAHLSLARSLPRTTPVAEMCQCQCCNHSQALLMAVSSTLQKARQTLGSYPCSPEEIDYKDITKDKTSTVKACVPMELVKNGSCLASGHASFTTNWSCLTSRKTSSMMSLCLNSIYEDLKLYQLEFKAMNAKLLMDPKRQIFLDQNMLSAIDVLMQALNVSSESVPQRPTFEKLDFYETKINLCIRLHAFRNRAEKYHYEDYYLNYSDFYDALNYQEGVYF